MLDRNIRNEMVEGRQRTIESHFGEGAGTAADIASEHGIPMSAVKSTQAFAIPAHNIRAIEGLAGVSAKSRK